ncbi:unnamed protein product [Rhizophagus irregularis]|uniref:Uncharacterized protein n=5 Tax=Rhizophagus irregularis TaxID=588596 RepID=A0A915ZRN9_9GLOM|nr:hypothetical protein GLOIN_2v1824557 [Rhizophagus irregularis DAOM 181602=DAOM 197198]POG75012.1 hypothetical protein GLOIN_2v1824557 [Rhizophagus irregularis DAOM 181602=DAOM 197198]GBC53731.2 hypothetical protein GLOIN_2v1824557 [Rhizophagus irregularis DAOM 181602=DAOM 197198]CAB4484988.1 unnamed protein product [Rhizophagus irregularis]CAB5385281.1 unnamed protein product [Rhizophagus irregularis]|eukprot:XP_025181878.1 hypothetical protein GLOIN_2v1824557 [Rhizophagus irregularis DAOM 181602=DAOM 197198]
MFFYNYRSTEPVWFRFFRDFFAIILTGIIVYYSFIQFLKIDTKASIDIKFESIYGHSLNMSICTGISNGVNKVEFNSESYGANPTLTNETINHQNISLNYYSSYSSYSWLNITTNINNNISETIPRNFSDPYCNPHTIPNNLLSLNFESLQYFSITDESYLIFNTDKYNVNSNKNNIINNDDNYDIETAHFSLYLGRAYFISYKPIIVSNEDIKYILELNPRLEQLPIQLESNEVRVKVLLLSDPRIARFETTRKYDYTDLISKLGGFYGAIAGIFYLFFGMQRHKPWGLAQKYLFSCTQCRKSLKKYFAKKYVSSAGIPLVEKVNKRPEGSSLEERVQILESLLQDYYLDDYYLKKIKDVRTKHKKLLKKYGRQDNENTENTELNASLV